MSSKTCFRDASRWKANKIKWDELEAPEKENWKRREKNMEPKPPKIQSAGGEAGDRNLEREINSNWRVNMLEGVYH